MDRGAWWNTVHGVAKSQTRLSNWAHTHGTLTPSLHQRTDHPERKSIENISSEIEKTSIVLTNIQDDWRGAPSTYLTDNMRKSITNFNTYVEVLNDYKKYLDEVLNDIVTMENYNDAVINSVLGG